MKTLDSCSASPPSVWLPTYQRVMELLHHLTSTTTIDKEASRGISQTKSGDDNNQQHDIISHNNHNNNDHHNQAVAFRASHPLSIAHHPD